MPTPAAPRILLLASAPAGNGLPPSILIGVLAAASEPRRVTPADMEAAIARLDAQAERIVRRVGDDTLCDLADGVRSPRRPELWRPVEIAATAEMRRRSLCRECGAARGECSCEVSR